MEGEILSNLGGYVSESAFVSFSETDEENAMGKELWRARGFGRTSDVTGYCIHTLSLSSLHHQSLCIS